MTLRSKLSEDKIPKGFQVRPLDAPHVGANNDALRETIKSLGARGLKELTAFVEQKGYCFLDESGKHAGKQTLTGVFDERALYVCNTCGEIYEIPASDEVRAAWKQSLTFH